MLDFSLANTNKFILYLVICYGFVILLNCQRILYKLYTLMKAQVIIYSLTQVIRCAWVFEKWLYEHVISTIYP